MKLKLSKIWQGIITGTITGVIVAIILSLWRFLYKESFFKFWQLQISLWAIVMSITIIIIIKIVINKRKMQFNREYMDIVDKLMKTADVEHWNILTFELLSSEQTIYVTQYNKLVELNEYIVSLNLQGKKYVKVDNAIKNFRKILDDLLKAFNKYSELTSNGEKYKTSRFYKIDKWDTKLYHELLNEFEYHCILIMDLTVELTRAINYIFKQVRENICSSFRLVDGDICITTGSKIYKVNYSKNNKLYDGLEAFMKDRETRDLSFGKGINKKYL